jgi:hypothetical protein
MRSLTWAKISLLINGLSQIVVDTLLSLGLGGNRE